MPAADDPATRPALLELVEVMDRLRRECPWDREQTHESLTRYLLEETYETLEAIESGDPAHLREELGDLLMQVYFHARVAEEVPRDEGGFDVEIDSPPAGELGAWLDAHARTGRTGVIFRGSWGRGTGRIDGIALAAADGHATFVDAGPALDVADEQALAAWLADPAATSAFHADELTAWSPTRRGGLEAVEMTACRWATRSVGFSVELTVDLPGVDLSWPNATDATPQC